MQFNAKMGNLTAQSVADEVRASIEEELEKALDVHGGFGSLSVLHVPATGVADNPFKFLIRNKAKKATAVLLHSRIAAPMAVADAMKKAMVAKALLGDRLGRVILVPLLQGEVDRLGYAVLPYKVPLSDSAFFWPLQRAIVRPAVLSWLRQMTEATVANSTSLGAERDFVAPLEYIATLPDLDEAIRTAAAISIKRLKSGQWVPRYVLEHNDLWKGNILLEPSSDSMLHLGTEFLVIDWLGSKPQGHAIYDLIRAAVSMGLSRHKLVQELTVHCDILGCAPLDARGYLLASLGYLGQHLNCFPIEQYRATVDCCCRTLFLLTEADS